MPTPQVTNEGFAKAGEVSWQEPRFFHRQVQKGGMARSEV
jgi:hypothetical protein